MILQTSIPILHLITMIKCPFSIVFNRLIIVKALIGASNWEKVVVVALFGHWNFMKHRWQLYWICRVKSPCYRHRPPPAGKQSGFNKEVVNLGGETRRGWLLQTGILATEGKKCSLDNLTSFLQTNNVVSFGWINVPPFGGAASSIIESWLFIVKT